MFLFIIFVSYLIGCISTIAILIYLYMRYGLYPPGTIAEQEQFQTFHPLPVNDQSKNSTVDTLNYLFQFLFQEIKDTSKVRHYIMKKLIIEFNEMKQTKIGKMFLKDISVQSFSLGKECPILSDIQLERQVRDERQLIKEVVTKLNLDYKGGFSVTLEITLAFGYKCQLFVKVKRIQGRLRLEFRREPFSHWLSVFQDEPTIELEIKSYLSSRESPQLAQIINQQIRRAIRRKQTWPSYKIRYQPFFPSSKQQSLSTEMLLPNENKLIPGKFNIKIKYCDRLSIPFEIFNNDEDSLLSIFLTININEHMCKDYLHMNRDQWIKKEFEFIPKIHKINVKEVAYMNRREFLIDEFDPIPKDIEDQEGFKFALSDKNIFLLQIQGQKVKTLRQINRLIHGNEEQIKILIGMPLLHSIRVRRIVESMNTTREEEADQFTDSDDSIQQQDSDLIKIKNSSPDKITLIMMNNDVLETFQAQATPTRKPEPYVKFDDKFELQAGPNERFLNICLWCKPPLDCDVPNLEKKLVLLGYASASLSEIVFDTLINFKRETQMTLNFRPVYSDNPKDSENKKLAELSTHKCYDDNMAHGYVTINIKHQPENEMNSNKERLNLTESVALEKDDEQLTTSINEEHELLPPKSTDHIFEDQHFNDATLCAYCNKKIWMKVGRRCRDCSRTVHKKCEKKFNNETICLHEPIQSKSIISEDENSILSNDDINSRPTTHHFTRARRPFSRFREKTVNETPNLTLPELSKTDDLDNNSLSHTEKPLTSNPPVQRSSILVNAASLAYSKFREFKSKRSSILESKKRRSSSDLTTIGNISETDLQDIITSCLSDENVDTKSLENLFHEKAVNHTAVYAKANQFGPELFGDITLEERKQMLEDQISRLQQEIDLQSHVRDEMIIEYNNNLKDENVKRKIQARIDNIDEKIQALAALTIFYCSALRYCHSDMETRNDNSKNFDENSYNQLNDTQCDN